jgi:nitrite reductase (NADH) large subunit
MSKLIRKRLVVIGNGMAGARVVEEILQRAPAMFDIVMIGAEPYGNYNRILLSNVLNKTQQPAGIFLNPLAWYQQSGITLHAGVKALRIDRERRVVVAAALSGGEAPYAATTTAGAPLMDMPYDFVIIATGSRPFVPPMEGFGKPGTFLFRTLDDCARIAEGARNCKKAAVIGGGLLGLEAARGLLAHGVEVTVVEASPQLMIAQLDATAGETLKTVMETLGVRVICQKITASVDSQDGKIASLSFGDGSKLETDMVVVGAGIRPITEVATASGLRVEKAILCDDQMRASDAGIFALGECAQHRGKIYGLVEPIWEQARTLADVITGANPNAAYTGSKLATKLKVMGVELASMGEIKPAGPGDEVLVYHEPSRGVYKKAIIRDGKLAGAILLGETDQAARLMQLFVSGGALPARRSELLFGGAGQAAALGACGLPDDAQICNCNGVSKGRIMDAMRQGCVTVGRIGAATRAGTGCGSCKKQIGELLASAPASGAADASESWYVPGIPLGKAGLVAEIRARGLKSVSAVFRELAGGKDDPASKAGLASLLKSVWPMECVDERDARFVNDRVHANIQNDGTYSVVPRIYGGVTTAEELRRIADVAVKYNVRMVKFTGGQRIDLLGVNKEDLPLVWKDLGMPSGHAYTKAFRTCKSCVGTDFCRYAAGDSIALAQKIERRFQGVESPHKMKLATAGCPRNCSEAYVKDIGAVAIEGGKWEIYIGGAAGSSVRKGDLLCVVDTHDDVLKHMGRFMQYYREHARYQERSHAFVERLGAARLRSILIGDCEGVCGQLDARIQEAVDAYKDPWLEADAPAYASQFSAAETALIPGEI